MVALNRALLWLFVLVLGIGVGAGLYEAIVIMPLWSAAPPESVWAWHDLLAADSPYAPRAGERFWIFVSPARAVLALAVLVTALRVRVPLRAWQIAASLITLALFAIAVAWLIPVGAELFGSGSRQLSAGDVVSKVQTWVRLNYLFQLLGLAAFLAALRAAAAGAK